MVTVVVHLVVGNVPSISQLKQQPQSLKKRQHSNLSHLLTRFLTEV
jgi:hypothetical protein